MVSLFDGQAIEEKLKVFFFLCAIDGGIWDEM